MPRVALPWAPGFRAKTVRDAGPFERQRFDRQNLVLEHAPQRDLGRRDQRQVGVLDGVNLRLRPARQKADPLQDFIPSEVRRREQREPLAEQFLDRVLNEGQFQQDGLVLEVIKPMPGHLRPRRQIKQIERLH